VLSGRTTPPLAADALFAAFLSKQPA